jgi:hypothetical protein
MELLQIYYSDLDPVRVNESYINRLLGGRYGRSGKSNDSLKWSQRRTGVYGDTTSKLGQPRGCWIGSGRL